jgi:hypothetical protein
VAKRPASFNPITLKELRSRGFIAESVEHFSGGVRHDLFGWTDILAVRPDQVALIQVTSKSNMSARVKKIRTAENYPAVAACPVRVYVWGWYQPGGPRTKWHLVEKEILADEG